MTMKETNRLMNCPLCTREGKATPLSTDVATLLKICPIHGAIDDEKWIDAEMAREIADQEKQNGTELERLFAQVDVNGKLVEALKDIIGTDSRVDNFRTMKILMLYQAGLMEAVSNKLDALGSVAVGFETALNSIGKLIAELLIEAKKGKK